MAKVKTETAGWTGPIVEEIAESERGAEDGVSMSGRSEAAEEIARQVKLQLDVKLAEAARVPVPDSSIGTEALTLMDSP